MEKGWDGRHSGLGGLGGLRGRKGGGRRPRSESISTKEPDSERILNDVLQTERVGIRCLVAVLLPRVMVSYDWLPDLRHHEIVHEGEGKGK